MILRKVKKTLLVEHLAKKLLVSSVNREKSQTANDRWLALMIVLSTSMKVEMTKKIISMSAWLIATISLQRELLHLS